MGCRGKEREGPGGPFLEDVVGTQALRKVSITPEGSCVSVIKRGHLSRDGPPKALGTVCSGPRAFRHCFEALAPWVCGPSVAVQLTIISIWCWLPHLHSLLIITLESGMGGTSC